MEAGRTYIMKPSPGFDGFGNCLGCGQPTMTSAGHMCLVEAGPSSRQFEITIIVKEVQAQLPGFQTTTHPGYEVVWTNQHLVNS